MDEIPSGEDFDLVSADRLDRPQLFKDGYRLANRRAVAWLHRRAAMMDDPKAKAILDSAATNLGWAFARDENYPAHLQSLHPAIRKGEA